MLFKKIKVCSEEFDWWKMFNDTHEIVYISIAFPIIKIFLVETNYVIILKLQGFDQWKGSSCFVLDFAYMFTSAKISFETFL